MPKSYIMAAHQQQGAIAIQLILTKIADGDNDAVRENLTRFPLGIISKDQAETLLSWFLNQAVKSTNTDAIRIIITAFDLGRIRVDPLPAITNIFLNPQLSREVLMFTISCYPEKVPVDFFIDLINMGDDMAALKAAGILTTFFPQLSHNDWSTLVKLTDNVEEEEYENQLLRAYFITKAAESGKCGSRPKWIRDDLPVPTIEPVPDTIPSVKEAVDLLMSDLLLQKMISTDPAEGEQHDLAVESRLRETLISQYAISTATEKIQMLSPVREIAQFNDIPHFQEFGPVNTIYTLHPSLLDPTHDCCKYGGCHMLLCNEFEQVYSDGDQIDVMAADEELYVRDWFRKSCDNPKCQQRIAKRLYAVRRPLNHGGWSGCYCSFECMEPDIDSLQVAVMVGRMKEQLEVLGIRER